MNVDTFLAVDHFVRPGETMLSSGLSQALGGKGLNQAVAAARMGAEVIMLGAVGDDPSGREALAQLAGEAHLDASRVLRLPELPTGEAIIQSAGGDNAIIVVAGANGGNLPETVADRLGDIGPGDVLVCQLEIPRDTVAEGFRVATARGATVVFNPSPAAPVADLLADVDLLIVNETEAAELLGGDDADAARTLRERYDVDVIVTLGARGALVLDADGETQLAAVAVDVVDTTGAGDAFLGGVCAALAEDKPLSTAARYGAAMAAAACSAAGAQGYPQRRADVERLIAES